MAKRRQPNSTDLSPKVIEASKANTLLEQKIPEWVESPQTFARECLSLSLTAQQEDLLQKVGMLVTCKLLVRLRGEENVSDEIRAMARKRGISVRAGKGLGKDFIAAALILWYLSLMADTQFNTKIATLAPTKDALKTVLWSEVSKLYGQSDSKGEPKFVRYFKDKLVLESERIYNKSIEKGKDNCQCFQRTVRRSANKTETTTALGGLHADNLMIIIDEATAVPDEVFDGLISTMTDPNNFAILIYNPTTTAGYAARTHLDPELKEHWITLHWDAHHCERIGRDYLDAMRHKYGEGSNSWKAFVTGEFPIDNDGALINMQWVYDALDRDSFVHHKEQTVAGVDPGAGGNDPSVICVRRGAKVLHFHRIFEDEPDAIAEKIARHLIDDGVDQIYVDSNGPGEYLCTLLRQRFPVVIGLKGSQQAHQHDKFKRRRDELLWVVRERFMKREISIPRNETLQEELLAISYDEGLLDGKVKVEGKDSLRKRLGRSIDHVDALSLAFYGTDHSGELRVRTETDPYADEDSDWADGVVGDYAWMSN